MDALHSAVFYAMRFAHFTAQKTAPFRSPLNLALASQTFRTEKVVTMDKCKNILMLTFISIILAACASGPPTKEELASADYGSVISQSDAQQKAQSFLSNRLKDPYSAQYQWGNVYQGWIRHAPIHGGGLVFGYILDVNVNAKNSFGGYVGFKPYRFVFYNGAIKTVYGQQELDGGTTYMGKIY